MVFLVYKDWLQEESPPILVDKSQALADFYHVIDLIFVLFCFVIPLNLKRKGQKPFAGKEKQRLNDMIFGRF